MRADKGKEVFLNAYALTLGDIGKSCQAAKVCRTTFYSWFKADANFKSACEHIEEEFIDTCEGLLRKRILNNEWIPLRYYLENRAGRRWRNVDVPAHDINLGGTLKVEITKTIIGGQDHGN
jgi:hypothetical protein